MPTASTIAVLFVAAPALLLVPGREVLYTVARSVHLGRMTGLVSAAAAAVGDLAHVCGAALGLSALLLSSALVFSGITYGGFRISARNGALGHHV
jgi:threonine/homoserine/homoserine lactone efflux protein